MGNEEIEYRVIPYMSGFCIIRRDQHGQMYLRVKSGRYKRFNHYDRAEEYMAEHKRLGLAFYEQVPGWR